jgi:hypothetical protein
MSGFTFDAEVSLPRLEFDDVERWVAGNKIFDPPIAYVETGLCSRMRGIELRP